MSNHQIPKGFHDYDSVTMERFEYLTNCLKKLSSNYGFDQIKLSTVEYATIADTLEATKDKDYRFLDRKNRELLLATDSSLSVLRYISTLFPITKTHKISSLVPVFRYRGKYRQRHHYVYETIHQKNSLYYDTSLFALSVDIIKFLNVKNYKIIVRDFEVFSLLFNGKLNSEEIVELLYLHRFNKSPERIELLLGSIEEQQVVEIFHELVSSKEINLFEFQNLIYKTQIPSLINRVEEINMILKPFEAIYPYIAFDFSHLASSEFYDGFSYRAYDSDANLILEGGRYDSFASSFLEDNTIKANGMAVCLEYIMNTEYVKKIIPVKEKIYVFTFGKSNDQVFNNIQKIRAEYPNAFIHEDLSTKSINKAKRKSIKSSFTYFIALGEEELKTGIYNSEKLSKDRDLVSQY